MIIPVAKTLYLCDGHIGFANHKTDLMGLFNSIWPSEYPHVHKRFVVFAQLIFGLGDVPFYVDVRSAANGKLVHTSGTLSLHFPSRTKLVQLVVTINNCLFREAGIYLVELYCDNQWVADTTLALLESGDDV